MAGEVCFPVRIGLFVVGRNIGIAYAINVFPVFKCIVKCFGMRVRKPETPLYTFSYSELRFHFYNRAAVKRNGDFCHDFENMPCLLRIKYRFGVVFDCTDDVFKAAALA